MARYRNLDHDKLLGTIESITQRILALFPPSGLGEVSVELLATAKHCLAEVREIKKPLWKLRAVVAASVVALTLLPALPAFGMNFPLKFATLAEFLSATDAGFNILLLLAGGVLFLISVESRIKRNRTLRALNELRSLAHVVDMHQLSKDPGVQAEPLAPRVPGRRPPVIRNQGDLWHYLNFCGDLLAVLGKLAACFAEAVTDRSVLDSINEIEMLCTALSRKIWHKMSIVKPPGPEWTALQPASRGSSGPSAPASFH
jgi:hypothetical protein